MTKVAYQVHRNRVEGALHHLKAEGFEPTRMERLSVLGISIEVADNQLEQVESIIRQHDDRATRIDV